MPSTNPMNLSSRTILITGAAQGIGKAISKLCSDLGANVVLADRNMETLQETLKEFPADRTMAVDGNVANEEFARDCVAKSVDRFGSLHGLVNNAGIIRPAMLEKMTLMLQAAGRHMLERARGELPTPTGVTGSIVNISSTGGKRGSIGQVNYSSAKSGIFGMTMTAALEWAKYGVRCNSVGFGTVITSMTETLRSEKFSAQTLARIPLGRCAEPEEAANLVVFLLSNAASYITGENMTVSGGLHMQP
ncbi:MAG: SDR family oxidoreductase [Proteobacteria bacterium]|nr:SDR family oxidoreductase [Pseudomonadota bacterium]